MEAAIFKKVSQLLTGFEELPENLLMSYYIKLSSSDGYGEEFFKLLDCVSNMPEIALDDLLKENSIDKKLFKGIVFLWYTSELILWNHLDENSDLLKKTDNRIAGTQEEYYGGLIWKAIRAHPLALSGGYYGHWKYEPEN